MVVGEELSELLAGGAVAEALAGPVVELVGDGLELGGGVDGQVGALGEVLAEQPVDVLVAAAPPATRASSQHTLPLRSGVATIP